MLHQAFKEKFPVGKWMATCHHISWCTCWLCQHTATSKWQETWKPGQCIQHCSMAKAPKPIVILPPMPIPYRIVMTLKIIHACMDISMNSEW